MNEVYEQLIHEAYLASGQGDFDAYASYFAPDVTWHEAPGSPYGGTYVGMDEIIAGVFEPSGADWLDFSAKDQAYGFNGNTVYVYGQYSGKHVTTGKDFVADFVHIYEFNADDKIQTFTQVTDSATMRAAMA